MKNTNYSNPTIDIVELQAHDVVLASQQSDFGIDVTAEDIWGD